VTGLKLTESQLILGEGLDDIWFLAAVCRQALGGGTIDAITRDNGDTIGLRIGPWQLVHYRGKGNLRGFLKALVAMEGFTRITKLGVTRDADDSFLGAFDSAANALSDAGLPRPIAQGQYVGPSPMTGVFVFPKDQCQGSLEDLCWESVVGQPEAQCVEYLFSCLGVSHASIRAKVTAYLAAVMQDDCRLGIAASRGKWLITHSAFADILQFCS